MPWTSLQENLWGGEKRAAQLNIWERHERSAARSDDAVNNQSDELKALVDYELSGYKKPLQKEMGVFTHTDGSEQEHIDSRLVESGMEPATRHLRGDNVIFINALPASLLADVYSCTKRKTASL